MYRGSKIGKEKRVIHNYNSNSSQTRIKIQIEEKTLIKLQRWILLVKEKVIFQKLLLQLGRNLLLKKLYRNNLYNKLSLIPSEEKKLHFL